MKLSQGVSRMSPPATRAIAEKAEELKASGKSILSLASGAPSFATPEAANEYARMAVLEGRTFYTPTAGIPELRDEVAAYYRKRFNVHYERQQVIIGAGAKPLIFETLGALVDDGDEVIVFAPAWVSYVEQIRFFGGRPVVIDNDERTYDIDLDRLRRAVSDRTVALVINSPHNPTGRVFDRRTIEAICEVAVKNGLVLINDEVYERITFNGIDYQNPLCYCPKAYNNVVNINAVSKTYSMTGWRIGFALGPAQLTKKITALQGHLTSGACSVAQWAALGALREAEREVQEMVSEFQRRREIMLAELDTVPDVSFGEPEGAFYVFVDIRRIIGKRHGSTPITNDVAFVETLLEKEQVSAVPGTAFLFPGYIRLSYTQSEENTREGVARLKNFIDQLE